MNTNINIDQYCKEIKKAMRCSPKGKRIILKNVRSGNKAIGNGAFDRKLFSFVLETQTCEVVLTCDTNGNLS